MTPYEAFKKAIIAEKETLNEVEFVINGELQKFYFKELSGLDFQKIKNRSIVKKRETQLDGSVNETEYLDEQELRANIILEMARDKDGKRLFSLTNSEHKELVKSIKFTTQSYLAYEMGLQPERDILEAQRAKIKKMYS